MFSPFSSRAFSNAFTSVHPCSSVVSLACSSTTHTPPPDDTQPEITYHGKDPMAEHIEDLQQRFAELNKRIQLVRSFL
jgi:hypothetical protein